MSLTTLKFDKNWNTIEPKVNQIREGLTSIIFNLLKESVAENVSKPENSLRLAHDMISHPEYNIVVCGEVKRGKSTFINALIGDKNLLPTGNKETTSQVFRISNSNKKSYYLVFKNGEREEITREELSRYGSQTDADLMGESGLKGRILDFIQINTPVTFLPEGVNIVDTPGLGALYKSHGEITNEYVRKADAVVFLLSSGAPLVQEERDFLKKVFSVTPYVLFVMSQIDTIDNENWINLIRRDEGILKEHFDNCSTVKIFPISSKLLADAASEQNAALQEMSLEVSYFPQVKEELMAMIFRAVGIPRNRFAFEESKRYIDQNRPRIEEQCNSIASQNAREQDAIRNKLESLEKDFTEKFGERSGKRNQIYSEVSAVLNAARTQCIQIFDMAGKIYKTEVAEIDKLSTLEEAQNLSQKMGKETVSMISSEWEQITNNAQERVVHLVRVFQNEIALQRMQNFQFSEGNTSISIDDNVIKGGIQGVMKTALPSMGAYFAGNALLSLVGISIPIALPFVILGAAVFGWFKGTEERAAKELREAKYKLKEALQNLMCDARRQLTEINMSDGKIRSVIDSFVYAVETGVKSKIEEFFRKGQEQYQQDRRVLEEQRKLQGEKRKMEIEKHNSQRNRWLSIENELKKQQVILKELIDTLETEITT